MGNGKAKAINLLLYQGDLSGVISIEGSSWNLGEMYSAPRHSVTELLNTGVCNKYGVYMLLSQDMVYIGQSSDLAKRITQHIIGKDWWESVVICTTKDDSLNHTDIDYLESALIEKAQKINRLDCDNKTKGNPVKVDKFRRVYLEQYLEEALFLMQLIGIKVFHERKTTATKLQPSTAIIKTIDTKTTLALGKRAKTEAISFAKSKGYVFGKMVSYANKQDKGYFWINPRCDVLKEEWDIVLNDSQNMELIMIHVPANTFRLRSGNEGHLFVRSDVPYRIDQRIGLPSLMDLRGDADFKPYVVSRIKY